MNLRNFRDAALIGASLALSGTAFADDLTRPLTYSLSQSFVRDSNVFRLGDNVAVPANPVIGPQGGPRGDTIGRTSVGINFNNTTGTQVVTLGANLDFTRYQRYSYLNRNGYGISGAWQADLDSAWYASANLSSAKANTEFLNQFGLASNSATTSTLGGKVGYRFTPTWSVFSGLTAIKIGNSAGVSQAANTSQRLLEAGAKYDPGTGLNGELLLQRRSLDYANRQIFDAFGNTLPSSVDNSFNATQLMARASYQATGQSSFTGQIGYSNQRFNTLTQRDSSGLLFGVTYRYLYSDTFNVGLRLNRDIAGDQSSFSSPVQSTRAGFDASWKATGRITVLGSFDADRRKFSADPGVILGTNNLSADRSKTLALNARYELFRTVNLTAGLQRVSRSANVASIPFSSNIASLAVDFRFD